MGQILNDTLSQIYENLGDEIENLSVQHVAIGLFFTGAKLTDGVCGVSYASLKSFLYAFYCALQTAIMPNFGNICGKT
nr:DUF4213 domain-containing protein [uncultured Campylobacter sp.]